MKYTFSVTMFTATAIVIFLAVIFASCSKSSNPQSTTVVKCVTCANGGICKNDTCMCPAGYEGTTCETLSRQKFLGSWTVFEKGSITIAAQYQVSIESSNNITQISILNFNNYFTVPVVATITGDTIVIPNQQYNGKTVFGVGYIYSNVTYGQFGAISLSYEVIDTATNKADDYGLYSNLDLSNPSAWNK